MYSLFYRCNNLVETIPENLFANCKEVTSFSNAFASCIVETGNTPTLWEREIVTNSARCYQECTNLSNYADIPVVWK